MDLGLRVVLEVIAVLVVLVVLAVLMVLVVLVVLAAWVAQEIQEVRLGGGNNNNGQGIPGNRMNPFANANPFVPPAPNPFPGGPGGPGNPLGNMIPIRRPIASIKGEIKPEDVPKWDGAYETAVDYFHEIQHWANLGGTRLIFNSHFIHQSVLIIASDASQMEDTAETTVIDEFGFNRDEDLDWEDVEMTGDS
ncbi:hypothetical protein C8J56DRAFT_884461 [Mycena floridula]|nr:hypothetical protein C8J56DRAFT_884461 [Mycena floridula]